MPTTSLISYPKPLKSGGTIGVTAPSSGLGTPVFQERFDLVKTQFEEVGYRVVEGRCLREDQKSVSARAQDRAKDFSQMWENSTVDAIIPPWGGERLIEILPLLDFEALARVSQPKWILGYSDLSTLLFPVTLKTRIATAHGLNFMDLVKGQAYGLREKYLETLALTSGSSFSQDSFPMYQTAWKDFATDLHATFQLTSPTEWKNLRNRESETFSGRLIGGCLDTLVHLVGTPYGDLPRFIHDFRNDGVVFYLENVNLSPSTVVRALLQMKFAGWFEGLAGILIGRSSGPDAKSSSGLSYREALESSLGDLPFPVVYDMDFGHQPPQMLFVNGAKAEVRYSAGKGYVRQSLV